MAPFGPFELIAPTRVVAVVDEDHRFGFAYATLPGHPERGEESFVVERLPEGVVRFTIAVEAEPATRLGRMLRPVGDRLQTAALRRYLAAVKRYVECAP